MEQQQQKTVDFKYDHPIIIEMESKYRSARTTFYLTILLLIIALAFDIPLLEGNYLKFSVVMIVFNVLYFVRLILCIAKQFVAIMKADYKRKAELVDGVMETK